MSGNDVRHGINKTGKIFFKCDKDGEAFCKLHAEVEMVFLTCCFFCGILGGE